MRLFITGANSFVAEYVIKACNKNNIDWFGVDITHSSNKKIATCDILDKDIYKYINKNDIILHLAAISSDSLARNNIDNCYDINLLGTLNLFNAAKKSAATKFIFASTEWVYGDKCSNLMTEDNAVNILNLNSEYAKSKLLSEYLLLSRRNEGIINIILRFGIIYGMRNNNHSAFESIILNCINNNVVKIGSAKTARRFINVGLVANTIIDNIKVFDSGIYNIASAELVNLGQIIEATSIVLKRNIDLVEINPDEYTIRNVHSKYDNLRMLDSEMTLNMKIQELVNYYKNA